MHLSNIKLWNYRKFGTDTEITPDSLPNLDLNLTKGLNVIVGENDSGKTAIIDAIKLVLKTHSYDYIKIEDSDFHNKTSHFRIELTFCGLDPNEAKNFTEWLGWTGVGEDAVPYLKINYDVKRQGKKLTPSDVKAGVDKDGFQLTAEAREYLKATYLKPLRDAENELIAKRNSRLSQILLGDSAFKGKEDSNELIDIFSGLKSELENYFSGIDSETGAPKKTEGKEIKDKIDGYIKGFYGDTYETVFEATSTDIKSILEKLTLSLLNEPNPGLGTLNRLFMAAELLHLNKTNWSGIRLGLVEELEAHIHPQAQMQVIESLQKQKEIQLILTTHSPNLASKVKLENLILCTGKYAYPLGKEYTKLKETDYPFLERFLDVTKANLFFAKGLILVEGSAEDLIIPAMANKLYELNILPTNLTNSKVSVIAINNTAFSRYANIFKRIRHPYIQIPVAIINDIDLRPNEYACKYKIKPTNKKKENIITEFNSSNHIEAKKSKLENQYVKAFISNYWTLEYCIALHPKLRQLLFKAIYLAIEENRADNYFGIKSSKKSIRAIDEDKIETYWQKFIMDKTNEQVAFNMMYEFIIDKRKLSKAVIAIYFADLLSKDTELTRDDILIADNSIEYLINAIKYATGN